MSIVRGSLASCHTQPSMCLSSGVVLQVAALNHRCVYRRASLESCRTQPSVCLSSGAVLQVATLNHRCVYRQSSLASCRTQPSMCLSSGQSWKSPRTVFDVVVFGGGAASSIARRMLLTLQPRRLVVRHLLPSFAMLSPLQLGRVRASLAAIQSALDADCLLYTSDAADE